MSESRWRDYAAPIIARVLAETEGQEERVIRRALRDAYPFGERRMHPYKAWLSEVRNQRRKPARPEPLPSVVGGLFGEEQE